MGRTKTQAACVFRSLRHVEIMWRSIQNIGASLVAPSESPTNFSEEPSNIDGFVDRLWQE